MAVGSQSEGSGGIEFEWPARCDPKHDRRDLAPYRARKVHRALQKGPARWTVLGWSASYSTKASVGDAPCITHGSIGQRSCGRPQVDFKPTLFLIPIKSRHAHSPGRRSGPIALS